MKHADLEMEMLQTDSSRPVRYYQDLLKVSDRLLARNPDSYDGLRIKGQLAFLDGKTETAAQFFSHANSLKPMQPDVILLWSQILLQDSRAPEGEQMALNLMRARKSYGPIYDVLFRYYLLKDRRSEAEEILKTRVNNNPGQLGFALQLASWYASSGKKEETAALLARLTRDPKTFPDVHLQVGDFYTAQQDWPAALREGAKTDSKDHVTYLKRITDTLLAQGKGEEAAGVVAEILKVEPKDQAARAVDAALMVASRKPYKIDAGVRELNDLVAGNPKNPVWRFNPGLALIAKAISMRRSPNWKP